MRLDADWTMDLWAGGGAHPRLFMPKVTQDIVAWASKGGRSAMTAGLLLWLVGSEQCEG